jgi:hypothetical protein
VKARFVFLLPMLILFIACTPQTAVPTLMQLPTIESVPPQPVNTPAPTNTAESPAVQPVTEQSISPSPTITDTPSPTITDTSQPMLSLTPALPTDAPPETYYTIRTANARACPQTVGCSIVATFAVGTAFYVVGYVQGDAVNGNTLWRRTIYNGQEVYIHDSLLSKTAPAPTSPPNWIQPTVQPQIVQPAPPPVSQWNCSGNHYDCSDFSSCAAMRSYWNACPGDPSNLDGDNDGRPCESRCG